MTKIEFSQPDTDEKMYQIIPDNGKCFKSKLNGHKFIHTNGREGLPLYVSENEISLYEEIEI